MDKVALITGSAKRIGAVLAKTLHQQGMNVIIHYHHSKQAATYLCSELNSIRSHSACSLQADIREVKACIQLIKEAVSIWKRLDLLVNNASSFYPTALGNTYEDQWDDLLGSNLKGPFFLSQAAAPFLSENDGNIVNIADIHADKPLKHYAVYSIAKAGLVMLTKSLARELAPKIRVNAVAPGEVLWPNDQNELPERIKQSIIHRTCLKRQGAPKDIAETVLFLMRQNYITGQVIAVDGGRNIRS
jgi:pteridine reductase